MVRLETIDSSYHYPPELLNLLVDAISHLFRSKQDVIVFFRGAGVDTELLADWQGRIRQDYTSVKKYEIARSVLCRLNDRGDATLRQRREVIKRVVEFDDFSTCWPADQLKARGLVAEIQKVVNIKDSFTRINIEREKERKEKQAATEAALRASQQIQNERQEIRKSFYSLFAETDHKKRGKALEAVLNRLFQSYDILVKEAFTVKGEPGEGVVEQIDGTIELDGHLYLVEMKWWDKPIGRAEISPHLVSVFNRAEARGAFISHSGYTEGALRTVKEALTQKTYVLFELREIVMALEHDKDLKQILRKKVHAAITEKQPFLLFLNEQ